MLDKVNFFSQNNVSMGAYNYKVNNNTANEVISKTLKETKPPKEKFDWLDVEKLFEFLRKKKPANQRIIIYSKQLQYMAPGTREQVRNGKIQQEQQHIAKPISERTAYNTKQLKSAGVKDGDIKNYLTYDGHVNNAGKEILHEHGKSYK